MGGREQFDDVDIQLIRSDHEDPDNNEVAHAALRVTITGQDPSKFGRIFAAKTTELGLAGIPGNTSRGAAGFNGGPAIIHWPALISSQRLTERVHLGGKTTKVLPTQRLNMEETYYQEIPATIAPAPTGPTTRIPFGRLLAPALATKEETPIAEFGLKPTRPIAFCMNFLLSRSSSACCQILGNSRSSDMTCPTSKQ